MPRSQALDLKSVADLSRALGSYSAGDVAHARGFLSRIPAAELPAVQALLASVRDEVGQLAAHRAATP